MGIIREGFDGDVSAEWVPYTNVQRTVENGRLICSASTIMGTLLSPYILTPKNTLEFDISLVHDNSGLAHAGFWLYDKEKTNWLRVAFHSSEININTIPGYTPRDTIYHWNTLGRIHVDPLSAETRHVKAEFHSETNASFFIDDTLILTTEISFKPNGFAIFVYGCTIKIDNLVMTSESFVVRGKSLQDNGKPSRYVLIHDWETGNFLEKIIPSNNGNWVYAQDSDNQLLITHVGEDGFAPQADGGITPIIV